MSLAGNISRPVTIQELLPDPNLVPGLAGAYLKVQAGKRNVGIQYADISRLTILHNGLEFMLTRETISPATGQMITGRYRIYCGYLDRVIPPVFHSWLPNRDEQVERIIGQSHPRPIPYQLGWEQPSWSDIDYLRRIRASWKMLYGMNSEPFGRIFGDPGDPSVLYGPQSTHGRAVPP